MRTVLVPAKIVDKASYQSAQEARVMGKRHVPEATKERARTLFQAFKHDNLSSEVSSSNVWRGYKEARARISVIASRLVSWESIVVGVRANVLLPSDSHPLVEVHFEMVSRNKDAKTFKVAKNDRIVQKMGFAFEIPEDSSVELVPDTSDSEIVAAVSSGIDAITASFLKLSTKTKILETCNARPKHDKTPESLCEAILRRGLINQPEWVKGIEKGDIGILHIRTPFLGIPIRRPDGRMMNLLVTPSQVECAIRIKSYEKDTISVTVFGDLCAYGRLDVSCYRNGRYTQVTKSYGIYACEEDVILGIADQLHACMEQIRENVKRRKVPVALVESV